MTDESSRRGRPGANDVSLGASLVPAKSLAEFRRDPVGRWIGGPGFVYAWPTPSLCATVLFGEPTRDGLEQLAALFALELAPPAAPHASLIDARRIERVEATAYGALSEYVEARRDAMRGWVTRLALVRASGMVGAVTAGFYATVEPPYPVEVFAAPEEALAWCGADAGWIAALEACLDEGLAETTAAVRRAARADLRAASLESIARALAVSERTLQRRLREEGTTFLQALKAARVEEAARWLSETDAPVSRIAHEVGFATPQQLARALKDLRGVTPTELRVSARAEASE